MMANRLDRDEDTLIGNVNLQVRCSDEDLVSEFHQGQQAYRLHQQAEYKTATYTCNLNAKSLDLREASI